MTRILIRGGRVVDPSQSVDQTTDLVIEDGRIAGYGVSAEGGGSPENGGSQDGGAADAWDQIIDARGMVVTPGFIDTHVQLREPGYEEDETIGSGTAAARAGGFTTIACLPNSDPPIDTRASVEFVQHQAQRSGNCHVQVIACVSKNREGEQLSEIGSLVESGAIGFSDAPRSIANAELMRRALQYCRMFGSPLLSRPESPELTRGGIMHNGLVSTVLGLAGMPVEAEDLMTGRDLRLAEATGGRLHLMDISSAGSVELIRRAKARQQPVTADVCAINFALTDETLRSFDSNGKLNPPLRSSEHLEAVIEGLADGTIDAISSGHAPRAREKKMQVLDRAPFGMSALETTWSVIQTYLIDTQRLSWRQAVAKLTSHPARILQLSDRGQLPPRGTLQLGAAADITIIDPTAEWTVDGKKFVSAAANTPLDGQTLRGRIRHVLLDGRVAETAGLPVP